MNRFIAKVLIVLFASPLVSSTVVAQRTSEPNPTETLIKNATVLTITHGVLTNTDVLIRRGKIAGANPWRALTLEWATTSPPPFYNFAVIPTVTGRDAFWAMKQTKKPADTVYEDITLPKNTPIGMLVATAAFVMGFAIIWHCWWLAGLGLGAIIILVLIRISSDDIEYTIPAAEIARLEARRAKERAA